MTFKRVALATRHYLNRSVPNYFLTPTWLFDAFLAVRRSPINTTLLADLSLIPDQPNKKVRSKSYKKEKASEESGQASGGNRVGHARKQGRPQKGLGRHMGSLSKNVIKVESMRNASANTIRKEAKETYGTPAVALRPKS